jgi:hypothetical protein
MTGIVHLFDLVLLFSFDYHWWWGSFLLILEKNFEGLSPDEISVGYRGCIAGCVV